MNERGRPAQAAPLHQQTRADDDTAGLGGRPQLRAADQEHEAGDVWPSLKGHAPEPFPVAVLPAAARGWVEAMSEATQTPLDLAAAAVLSVLSASALGTPLDCGAWEEELGLFLLVALPSGERKSTVLKAAVSPLRTLESERREQAGPRVRSLAAKRETLDAQRKSLIRRAGECLDDADRVSLVEQLDQVDYELARLEPAVLPRLLADDATPEALGRLLGEQGRIAVISAESPFLDNVVTGRYSDGKANMHLACAAYGGESTTIDRASKEPQQLDRPLLTISLVVQPHVLQQLVGHQVARDQGMVARFAFIRPESLLGSRRVGTAPVPEHVSAAWAQLVRRVARAADSEPVGSVGFVSVKKVEGLRLSSAAVCLLHDLQRELEPRLAPGGDLEPIADWVNRHHGRVARIAGLLHLCERDVQEPVSPDTMRRALEIGRYLLSHALTVLSDADPQVRSAADWLRRHQASVVSLRDLHRGPGGGRGKVQDMEPLVDKLVVAGLLRPRPEPVSGSRGGRPKSQEFDVHPELVGQQAAGSPKGGA